jgi:hypothetical protein
MIRKGTQIIKFEEIDLEKIKQLADKNKRKAGKQDLLELAVEIANKAIDHLDDEDFENLFNLKL